MATFNKTAKGKWRTQVARQGVRDSGTFDTKREAQRWAIQREEEIEQGLKNKPERPKITLSQLFKRYTEEVSATKAKSGEVYEIKRLDFIPQSHPVFKELAEMEVPIQDITSDYISRWKNLRLLEVKKSTVLRERNLISNVFSMAVEWGYIKVSPFKGVSWPQETEGRDRPVSKQEIDLMLLCLDDWDKKTKPVTNAQKVAAMWCLALETAMRQREIKLLQPHEVDLENKVIRLIAGTTRDNRRTKEGRKKMLALNSEAIRILKLCHCPDANNWFGVSNSMAISGYFRKARINANIDDLRFHDSRHEAVTRLSDKLNVMELSRQTGIRDLKILMRYYEKQADDFVGKLD